VQRGLGVGVGPVEVAGVQGGAGHADERLDLGPGQGERLGLSHTTLRHMRGRPFMIVDRE
jgi:hypothetical protein